MRLVSTTARQASRSRSSSGNGRGADTCVVEQQVEPAEPRLDLREERRHRRGIADVARDGHRLGPRLRRRQLQLLSAPAGEDDGEAGARQRDRRRAADAAAGTRDERDPAHRCAAPIRPPSSSSTWTRTISSKLRLRPKPERPRPPRVEATGPAGDHAHDRLVGLAPDQSHGPLAADPRATRRSAPRTVAETPGIVRERRSPSAPPSSSAAWTRKSTAARGEANQCRTSSETGRTASSPFRGSRMMLEKNPDAARFGAPGRTQIVGRRMPDPVEEPPARVVGEQQLGDRLLRAVARQRRRARARRRSPPGTGGPNTAIDELKTTRGR